VQFSFFVLPIFYLSILPFNFICSQGPVESLQNKFSLILEDELLFQTLFFFNWFTGTNSHAYINVDLFVFLHVLK